MRRQIAVSLIAVLGLALSAGRAVGMEKAELVDAIASGAKLTKADAGRALDAFTGAVSGKLKKGDRISLVGFGSFSVSKRVASSNGCASNADVDFSSSASFTAKKEEGGRHTPFHNKIARIVPQADGTIQVLGPNNGASVSKGDPIVVYDRIGIAAGAVAGIVVAAVIASKSGGIELADTGEGPTVVGVVISGVPRRALQIGGALETLPPPVFDDPIGACPEGGYDGTIVSDDEILKEMLAATRLPQANVSAAYDTLLDTIVAVVNAGDFVDVGGFGRFVEQEILSATVADDPCAGLPENCPPTGSASVSFPYVDITATVETGALSAAELQGLEDTLQGIAKRAARTGRNPQTGKEIKIAAKKVAKFKAGAELSATVNK